MFGWKASALFMALAVVDPFVSTALLLPMQVKQVCASKIPSTPTTSTSIHMSTAPNGATYDAQKNSVFIRGLMNNLGKLCDRYICNGSPKTREQVFNVLDQIAAEAVDKEMVHQSIRMVKRAGVPMHKTYLEKYQLEMAQNDSSARKNEAAKRQDWEAQQKQQQSSNGGKSALSRRMNGDKPDFMTSSVTDPDSIANYANDKQAFQNAMDDSSINKDAPSPTISAEAASRVSKLIAQAGSGVAFEGQTLGVGGLDDVLAQIKRRIWTPLAAPPQLLQGTYILQTAYINSASFTHHSFWLLFWRPCFTELGIQPARGLLLYGKPGCGKSLLASALGRMLSPFRPITVVSGPEVLDKFVGSSEKNLRDIFDNPPDIYQKFRETEPDGGDSIAAAALHVVVMDEFDAVARSRGGSDGKGGQGDAGVARDSVVNQLLAKMDGVQPLCVPTLVIGLTNKRSLIEPALLRPGRFEVQIEIPPPKTNEQRVSILKVHTKHMHASGRLEVKDPLEGSTAQKVLSNSVVDPSLLSYDDLLAKLAVDCDGFSGAAIASAARAAASRALERAVEELSDSSSDVDIMDCLVTQSDFYEAIQDVKSSMGTYDHTEDEEQEETTVEAKE